MTELLDVMIIGVGFAGMYMLHRLRAAGFAVKAVEAAPEVGGTWYHNRYPGLRCDVESLEYGGVRTMRTNLGFDLNPRPSLQAAAATQREQRRSRLMK